METDFHSRWAIFGEAEIDAHSLTEQEWVALKSTYVVGEYTMPCCSARAVPKTSPNGLQFFAHYSGECATAPETIWHRESKSILTTVLRRMGITCEEEGYDAVAGRKWMADVYFEANGRKIAIEIQRSYQHLDDFLRRQRRYEESGVECYLRIYFSRIGLGGNELSQGTLQGHFLRKIGDWWWVAETEEAKYPLHNPLI
jgi:hypothetical protein